MATTPPPIDPQKTNVGTYNTQGQLVDSQGNVMTTPVTNQGSTPQTSMIAAAPPPGTTNSPSSPTNTPVTPTNTPQGQNRPSTGTPVSSPKPNVSVVDYLHSVGQPSDFASRQTMAKNAGIQNYTGTAKQNTDLLAHLKGSVTGAPPKENIAGTTDTSQPVVTIGSDTKPTTPTDEFISSVQDIFSKYGVQPAQSTASPETSYASYYSNVYQSLGLDQVKANIDGVMKQYADLKGKMADDINGVNENPWLTEGVRQGRIKSITDKYQTQFDTLNGQESIFQHLYETGRSESQHAADMMIQQSHDQQTLNRDTAFKLVDLAERRYESQATLAKQQENDPNIKEYQLAKTQGYSGTFTDFLKTKKQQTTIQVAGSSALADYRNARAMSAYEGSVQSTIKSFYPSGKSPIQAYGVSSQAINRIDQSLAEATDPNNPNKGAADLDLVDAYVQIARGGQAITETQVDTLLRSLGLKATFDVTAQKITGTAILDDGTRSEVAKLSHKIFAGQSTLAQKATTQINSQLKKQGVPDQFLLNSPDDAASYYSLDSSSVSSGVSVGTSVTAPDGQEILITD